MADAKSVLKVLFPFISMAATAGGPLGVMAANAAGRALGIDKVDPTPDGIATALTKAQVTDPEAMVKMQAAEQQFQLDAKKLNIQSIEDLEKIAADDRANARDREIKTGDRLTPRLLASTVLIAWIAVQFYILPHAMNGHAPDAAMAGILNRVLGTLDAALTLVLAYYFGSSAGSDRKSEMLASNTVH